MNLRYKVVVNGTEFAYFRFGSDAERCVQALRSQCLEDGKSLKEYDVCMENIVK